MATDEMILIQRAKDLDSDAWTEIYNRYYRKIYAYLCRSLGDTHLAEDMASAVFLGAVESIQGFTYRGISLSAWLFRIAHNMVIDHFRKVSFRRTRAIILPLREELLVETDQQEEAGERSENVRRLSMALRELTEDQRQVITLKFVDDLTNAEVAQILGKPKGSVKSLQHRALASLRRTLEEYRL